MYNSPQTSTVQLIWSMSARKVVASREEFHPTRTNSKNLLIYTVFYTTIQLERIIDVMMQSDRILGFGDLEDAGGGDERAVCCFNSH